MKYYEKQTEKETWIMAVDDKGNYSVASNLEPEPDGFIGPADPFGKGYKEIERERAEEVLGYDMGVE